MPANHLSRIGTPLSPSATKVMFLGAGELGKEVVIALQRLGVEVIAVDRYADAPGMQVAHRSHVINMTDPAALRAVIEKEHPHLVVPEIEAIATSVLADIEKEKIAEVIPTARAAQLTMNREGIRRLAAEELGLPTSACSASRKASSSAAWASPSATRTTPTKRAAAPNFPHRWSNRSGAKLDIPVPPISRTRSSNRSGYRQGNTLAITYPQFPWMHL